MLLRFNGNFREVIFTEETSTFVWTNIANLFNQSTAYAYWTDNYLTILGCTGPQAQLFGYQNKLLVQNKPLEQLTFLKQHPALGKKLIKNNLKALKASDPYFLCKETYQEKAFLSYKLLIEDHQSIAGLLSFAFPFDPSLLNEFMLEENRYQNVISRV